MRKLVEVADGRDCRDGQIRRGGTAKRDLVVGRAVNPAPAEAGGHRAVLPGDARGCLELRQRFLAGQAEATRALIDELGKIGDERLVECVEPCRAKGDIHRTGIVENTERRIEAVIQMQVDAVRLDSG